MRILFRTRRRSERGASITFALLLFLVCAAVGSVVLTAATASSGRMSRLSEMDRRYYCVSSAASLLRDCMDGATVTITETEKAELSRISIYTNGMLTGRVTDPADGTPSTTRVGEAEYEVSSGQLGKLLTDAAQRLYELPEDAEPTSWSQELSLTFDGDEYPELAASITQKLLSDGTMILVVSNAQGEPYTLSLIFTLERSEAFNRKSQDPDPEVTYQSDGTDTVMRVTRKSVTFTTTATTFRWTLNEIRKGAST